MKLRNILHTAIMTAYSREAVSDEHQQLLKALIDGFAKKGLRILQAAYHGYDPSDKVENHIPDIWARDDNEELYVLGEAKTCDDLASDRSKAQFLEFSNRQMTKGKSTGKALPFHIIVPKGCHAELVSKLSELGLNGKPNIVTWTLG